MLYQAAKIKRQTRRRDTEGAKKQSSQVDEETTRGSLVETVTHLGLSQLKNISAMLTQREEISLALPPTEVNDTVEFKFLGDSMEETLSMYRVWIQRIGRFIMYYLVGCLVMNHLEGWKVLDCLYFVTQTFTTVGYGNVHPTSSTGRIFVSFYIFVGILMIFGVISDVTFSIIRSVRKRYHRPQKLNKLQVIVRAVLNCFMWLCITLMVVVFGALVFSVNEGWTFAKGFYFATVTVFTVGYGDLLLEESSSMWFNIFYMLTAVPIIAVSLKKIASLKRHLEESELEQRLNSVELCDELLTAIQTTDKERVSRAEYVLHMLQLSGKIDAEHDILPWSLRFDEFDVDRSGYLTKEDVEVYKQKKDQEELEKESRTEVGRVEGDGGDVEGGSREGSGRRERGSSAPHRKKSLLMQITDETKDVVLETLHLKRGHQGGEASKLDLILSLHSKGREGEGSSNPMMIEMQEMKRSSGKRSSAPALSYSDPSVSDPSLPVSRSSRQARASLPVLSGGDRGGEERGQEEEKEEREEGQDAEGDREGVVTKRVSFLPSKE